MDLKLSKLVSLPSKSSFNTGLSPCKPVTLTRLLGSPRESLGTDCQPVTHRELKKRIVTKDVGPFKVTGLDVAVNSLQRVLQAAKAGDPEVYDQVKSAGMLCVRLVRGSRSKPSNHSWGTAIDLHFGSQVDGRQDGLCQVGLLRLYRFFHAEGWYWGAGFSKEDSMHFELADETVTRLLAG
ncbi:MAG: M15 family metallopeptidase [Chthonomonadaceae bacterium]|nr:M15 family metallopeptidase [Chthonomonadaceae bacterium]